MYSQEKQTEIVKTALDLTIMKNTLVKAISVTEDSTFEDEPKPPELHITLPAPPVEPKLPNFKKSQWGLYILSVIGVFLGLIFVFVGWGTRGFEYTYNSIADSTFITGVAILILSGYKLIFGPKRAKIDEDKRRQAYLASQEWHMIQAKYRHAIQEYNTTKHRMQSEAENTFMDAVKRYEEIILPDYNKRLKAWLDSKSRRLEWLHSELYQTEASLKELYDKTKLISASYRDYKLLSWLYEDMASSDHDIRYATELLDRNRQLVMTERVGDVTRDTISSFGTMLHSDLNKIADGVYTSNELLSNISSESSKARNRLNALIGLQGAQLIQTNSIRKQLESTARN